MGRDVLRRAIPGSIRVDPATEAHVSFSEGSGAPVVGNWAQSGAAKDG